MPKQSLSGLRSRLLKYLSEKKRKSGELLQEYVRRLKEVVPNSVIILYGSRARGEQLPCSDYDVAVILENIEDKVKVTEELRRVKPRGLDLDLIVLSVDELSDRVVQEMLKNSIVLHKGINIENL